MTRMSLETALNILKEQGFDYKIINNRYSIFVQGTEPDPNVLYTGREVVRRASFKEPKPTKGYSLQQAMTDLAIRGYLPGKEAGSGYVILLTSGDTMKFKNGRQLVSWTKGLLKQEKENEERNNTPMDIIVASHEDQGPTQEEPEKEGQTTEDYSSELPEYDNKFDEMFDLPEAQ